VDEREEDELSVSQPALKAVMLARFRELATHAFNPERGTVDPRACAQAASNGFFWGPFAFLGEVEDPE